MVSRSRSSLLAAECGSKRGKKALTLWEDGKAAASDATDVRAMAGAQGRA